MYPRMQWRNVGINRPELEIQNLGESQKVLLRTIGYKKEEVVASTK